MIKTDIRWTTVQLNLRSWNVENLVTSEQLYREREDKLLEMTSDLDVRAGQAANYVSFHDYYERNWKDCAFRWVFAFRKNLPTKGCNDTCRIKQPK